MSIGFVWLMYKQEIKNKYRLEMEQLTLGHEEK